MLTERTFLRVQSAAAKARLRRQWQMLGDELLAPFKVRPVVRRHPWLSLGGAMLTGFLAAGGLGRIASPSIAATPPRPTPVGVWLRQARRIVTSAIGAMMLNGWRDRGPAKAAVPARDPDDCSPDQ